MLCRTKNWRENKYNITNTGNREDLHTWKLEARKRRLTFLSSSTWISNVKYCFRFFTIMTKNGSFIPSVAAGSAGQVMYVDWTFDPTISRTFDCMSSSCGRLTWPLTTARCQRQKNIQYFAYWAWQHYQPITWQPDFIMSHLQQSGVRRSNWVAFVFSTKRELLT